MKYIFATSALFSAAAAFTLSAQIPTTQIPTMTCEHQGNNNRAGSCEIRETTLPAMPLNIDVGDRLTLFTDGLLEARNASGEVYGFERMAALLAMRPDASNAVEAAVEFGQEDDITVLTLTRLATGVESTTLLIAPRLGSAKPGSVKSGSVKSGTSRLESDVYVEQQSSISSDTMPTE